MIIAILVLLHPHQSALISGYPIKISRKSNDTSNVQLLSRSKSAAMRTISAFQKVVNLVKMIPFATRGKDNNDIARDFTEVKVKDILRWTSFFDKSTPLDHLTSTTTVDSNSRRSSTSDSYSGRTSSSWSQSDLTADDLPFWCRENEEYFNNRDDMLRKIPKEEWPFEESDQQSSISVLPDSLFLGNEGPFSPYHTSLSNTSFLHSERITDEVGEKAKRLLSQVRKQMVNPMMII
ncbi:uncharacterized protein LOC142505828 [Primulina tabacum]|uniref:uncharacterized protein LOC142505828 n=1 Tax=Primulina tabacum TaxID=48773 RepID=UPI003F5A093A